MAKIYNPAGYPIRHGKNLRVLLTYARQVGVISAEFRRADHAEANILILNYSDGNQGRSMFYQADIAARLLARARSWGRGLRVSGDPAFIAEYQRATGAKCC